HSTDVLVLILGQRVPGCLGDSLLLDQVDRPLVVVGHAERCAPDVHLEPAIGPPLSLGRKCGIGYPNEERSHSGVALTRIRCPNAFPIRCPQSYGRQPEREDVCRPDARGPGRAELSAKIVVSLSPESS